MTPASLPSLVAAEQTNKHSCWPVSSMSPALRSGFSANIDLTVDLDHPEREKSNQTFWRTDQRILCGSETDLNGYVNLKYHVIMCEPRKLEQHLPAMLRRESPGRTL